MKNTASESIRVYSMLLNADKLEATDVAIIDEAYCPNGHSLISDEVMFCDFKAIHIKIRNKKYLTDLFISPLVGDKSKLRLDKRLDKNIISEFLCPECKSRLPVVSPCSCGGELMAMYLDSSLKLSKSVTVCNRFGCPHSEVEGIEQLKSMQL